MASLKDLKGRITSVSSTQKITKAMKMVAAAKLRRAQEAAVAARPYAERMEGVVAALGASLASLEGASPLMVGTGSDKTHLIVVATSERGLCGGFNSNIVKAAKKKINALVADGKTVKIIVVGKKGLALLKRDYSSLIVDTVDLSAVKKIGFTDAQTIADDILARFENGDFDVCTLFFAHFKSVLEQITTEQQLIPVAMAAADNTGADNTLGGAAYEYEPDETDILKALLPRNLSVQVFKALLENGASEQGARMSAMDSATRNAGDMIDRLTLQYNRSRQAAITTELIEIIAGAEAL